MAHLFTTTITTAGLALLIHGASPSQSLPDLTTTFVSAAGVGGDWQSLEITGPASAVISNQGAAVRTSFAVAFFEDNNGNGIYEPAVDNLLGSTAVAGLAAGASVSVSATLSGTVRFRENLIWAMADSDGTVTESNEGNNSAHSGETCGGPDLTASLLVIPPCTTQRQSFVQARLGNGGSTSVGRVPMSFYNNDPALGGRRLGTAWTSRSLAPGEFEDVALPLPLGFPYGGVILAVADDQGFLSSTVSECNETNNTHSVPACNTRAAWTNYGTGVPGTLGEPRIVLDNRPIIGTAVQLEITNSSGQATAGAVLFGSASASWPTAMGGPILVQYDMMISLMLPPGIARYALPVPCDTRMCGTRYYFQAIQADPGAPFGASFTPGLEMTIGRL